MVRTKRAKADLNIDGLSHDDRERILRQAAAILKAPAVELPNSLDVSDLSNLEKLAYDQEAVIGAPQSLYGGLDSHHGIGDSRRGGPDKIQHQNQLSKINGGDLCHARLDSTIVYQRSSGSASFSISPPGKQPYSHRPPGNSAGHRTVNNWTPPMTGAGDQNRGGAQPQAIPKGASSNTGLEGYSVYSAPESCHPLHATAAPNKNVHLSLPSCPDDFAAFSWDDAADSAAVSDPDPRPFPFEGIRQTQQDGDSEFFDILGDSQWTDLGGTSNSSLLDPQPSPSPPTRSSGGWVDASALDFMPTTSRELSSSSDSAYTDSTEWILPQEDNVLQEAGQVDDSSTLYGVQNEELSCAGIIWTDGCDGIPSKRRRRQPFQCMKDREETGATRKLVACLRCRMQRVRVSFDVKITSKKEAF